jgi:CubicO group peptidase (beta-lactamase class C family)
MNARFQSQLEAAAESLGVPAVSAGYTVSDRVVRGAVGCDPDTVFRVASVTKPFTALLALALLDLEAGTGIWPEDVRIRHLLSHTSGFDCECGDLARFGSGDDALSAAVSELPGVRRFLGAEQAWSYANTGYWLAAHLASERAAEPYEEALMRHVVGPAGLESTTFGEPELAGTGPAAEGTAYPRARRASGGLVSNVTDLLRFGRRQLLRPQAAQLRVCHGKPVSGVYGLGLFGEQVGGTEVWGHVGSYGGFESSLLLVPGRGAVFAGLTNSSIGRRALRVLENAFFEEVLGAPRSIPATVDLPAGALERFAGTYVNGEGRYEVAANADGLAATFEDGEFWARPIGERTFEITHGDREAERFDFPLHGFGRFGSRLAEAVTG